MDANNLVENISAVMNLMAVDISEDDKQTFGVFFINEIIKANLEKREPDFIVPLTTLDFKG